MTHGLLDPFAFPDISWNSEKTQTLKTLTSVNKEVRSFFLGDNSISSFPSVSSLGDYSFWRS